MEIVDKLLKFIRSGIVSDKQKQELYDIVMGLKKKTDLQKRRFNMISSLGPNLKEHNTYKKVADFYGCTISAIRGSVTHVIVGLYHLPNEKMQILVNMVQECEEKIQK